MASPFDVSQRLALIRRLLADTQSPNPKNLVLEVGCGYGAISRELTACQFGHLLLVDIAPTLVTRVCETLELNGVVGDALTLPIQNEAIDLIVSSEVIEHCANPRLALCEFARILKPGGYLCLTTPNRRWRWLLRFGQIFSIRKFQDKEIFLFPWELISILENCGLVIEKVDGCHLLPWQIPFGKSITDKTSRFGKFLYRIQINFGVLFRKPG